MKELPSQKVLVEYIKRAVRLNDEGKPRRKGAKTKISTVAPADLVAALKANKAAKTYFAGLAPSHKRDYIEWITEAKREATRLKRLATTIEWLAEGKRRNWKYEKSSEIYALPGLPNLKSNPCKLRQVGSHLTIP